MTHSITCALLVSNPQHPEDVANWEGQPSGQSGSWLVSRSHTRQVCGLGAMFSSNSLFSHLVGLVTVFSLKMRHKLWPEKFVTWSQLELE